MNYDHAAEDGFVLVEILSAMVILAIAAIGFMHIVRDATFNTERSRTIQSAHYLAIDLLDKERLSGFQREPKSGIDELTGLNWEIETTAVLSENEMPQEIPEFAEISIQVWDEDQDKPEAAITTRLIYGGRGE